MRSLGRCLHFVALLTLAVTTFLCANAREASAIPVFAHRYGLSCQACHTIVPHLTPFGQLFLANGYRIRGVTPKPTFPLAVRVESSYASAGAADPDELMGGPTPKFIVDEMEVLLGGSLGTRGSYWGEGYLVDGGQPGRARDVWAAYRATPDQAKIPLTIRAGQFTLPLPLDPETFRETTQPYAIWGQTAGNNPFNFFDVKSGVEFAAGDPYRALAGTMSIVRGKDIASSLGADGLDTMFTLERAYGNWDLTAYRYDGSRSLSGLAYGNTIAVGGVGDRFWRNGYGVGWARGRTEVNAVYQNGNDSSADLYGDALSTSGAFFQARQTLGNRMFALARYDATQDANFGRTLTAGLGYRPSRNTRLTVFETRERDYLGNVLHVLSSSFLFAY